MFPNLSDQAREIVVKSESEARRLGHNFIGTEHLLLALLSSADGPTAELLNALGITHEKVEGIQAGVGEIVGLGPPLVPDASALETIGIDLDAVHRHVEAVFGPGALDRTRAVRATNHGLPIPSRLRVLRRRGCRNTGEVRFTPRARRVLELSLREARDLGGHQVAPEHLLLALLWQSDGVAARLLKHAGLDYESARRKILGERGNTA